MKESDLAKHVIVYFENQGYTCYKEVSKNGRGGSARNDCYFIKKDSEGNITETIAVETKMSLSIKVVHQSCIWKKMANRSYIGIPKGKRKDFKLRKFLIDICKNYLKIGIVEVDPKTNQTYEILPSEFNSKPILPPLYEGQKDSEAGNDKGEFHTAFKNTVNLLNKHMESLDKCEWNELIKSIQHHYKTNTSASNALKKYIDKKIIPNYKLIQEDKKFFIYKDIQQKHS